jgi:2-polyprenyl-6-hydroxyphenyl methylase / 3-demethylubiquinone-9 3-methyltransferase
MSTSNVDPREIARFDALAARWWDPRGEMKALHAINPLRLDYVDHRVALDGKRVLDVGCGGGLFAEGMARRGARVLGIDLSPAALEAARAHARGEGVAVDYAQIGAEALAATEARTYDVVTCLELLEHVPDPAALIAACARLARPGGQVIFSTLNRNAKAYLLAVVAAEYVLGLVPRGTHDYARFIKPSELDLWARAHGLTLIELTGMHYDPLALRWKLGTDVAVNYLAHYRAGDADAAP